MALPPRFGYFRLRNPNMYANAPAEADFATEDGMRLYEQSQAEYLDWRKRRIQFVEISDRVIKRRKRELRDQRPIQQWERNRDDVIVMGLHARGVYAVEA